LIDFDPGQIPKQIFESDSLNIFKEICFQWKVNPPKNPFFERPEYPAAECSEEGVRVCTSHWSKKVSEGGLGQ
jgi:hypothetical protein